MSLARRLLAEMDMHHTGTGVEGGLGFTRHLFRRHRNVMLFRIGQYAIQRAGNHSLVAHEASLLLAASVHAAWIVSTTSTVSGNWPSNCRIAMRSAPSPQPSTRTTSPRSGSVAERTVKRSEPLFAASIC